MGCTEPISLALACAVARFHLGVEPSKIEGKVSANLMKKWYGSHELPGTGTLGLPMAAAIGAIGGDPDNWFRSIETDYCIASRKSETVFTTRQSTS